MVERKVSIRRNRGGTPLIWEADALRQTIAEQKAEIERLRAPVSEEQKLAVARLIHPTIWNDETFNPTAEETKEARAGSLEIARSVIRALGGKVE